jgi:carboxylesterase type B
MNRGVVMGLMLIGLSAGQMAFARQATAEVADEPKSRAAREAADRYERDCMKAEAEARAARAELREQYVKELDEARKVALEKSDLDEAQRILNAKESVARPESRFKVIEARFISFGDPARQVPPAWTDVTNEVRRLVKSDKLVVSLEPQVGDHLKWPQPDQRTEVEYKYLILTYSIDGDVRQGIVSHPRWRAEFPELRKSR